MGSVTVARRRAWLNAFGALLGAVLIAWLLLPLATKDADLPASRWIHNGLQKKLTVAATKHDKVVLLGGSSVHFGLRAGHLERVYGMPAVNLGMHAGLGLRYILHYGKQVIHPGDTVVLSLEYGLWETERIQRERTYYILAYDHAYLYGLRPPALLRFLASVQPAEWAQLIRARWSRPVESIGGGYLAETIDEFGDETANDAPDSVAVDRLAKGGAPRRLQLDPDSIDLVREFDHELEQAGVRLILSFPYQLRQQFDHVTNSRFYRELVERLHAVGLRTVGAPEASVFDAGCIYDSAYHPIRSCAEKHTDRLADYLRNAN